jgi:cobalamin biosynthesis protein CobD/CbiB
VDFEVENAARARKLFVHGWCMVGAERTEVCEDLRKGGISERGDHVEMIVGRSQREQSRRAGAEAIILVVDSV